jgi:hypothetical protein
MGKTLIGSQGELVSRIKASDGANVATGFSTGGSVGSQPVDECEAFFMSLQGFLDIFAGSADSSFVGTLGCVQSSVLSEQLSLSLLALR